MGLYSGVAELSAAAGSPASLPFELEIRCPACHHLLFRATLLFAIPLVSIQTVCWKCRAKVTWPAINQAEKSDPGVGTRPGR